MRALLRGGALCFLAMGVVCVWGAALPDSPPPQLPTPPPSSTIKTVELNSNRSSTDKLTIETQPNNEQISVRSDKANNSPAIGESIKMVANQLLQGSKTPPPTTSGQGGIIEDVRTPPKMKNQQSQKNKVTKPLNNPPKVETIENSHAGVAIPMNPDDMNKAVLNNDQTLKNKESSTSDEGLSTWILLSGNPTTAGPKSEIKKSDENKNKSEDPLEKDNKKLAQSNKPKPKIPAKPTRSPSVVTVKPAFIRKPVAIGSSNKSDLIASGSAVNENVMNKIKASVLASIQKNKIAALNKTSTTTPTPVILLITSKKDIKEVTTESIVTPVKVHSNISPSVIKKTESKPTKAPIILSQGPSDKSSELLESREEPNDLSIESKHAEIELEVSTPPPSTTKKPKRTSNKRKKNKNRHRKPVSTTIKPEENTPESKPQRQDETKVATKISQTEKPITTQIYNYLSREVMPSVGVGLVSLAGIVGLASYLFYPFGGIVRRQYNVNDRKDDLYQQNGELYAGDGGQREEEMLGSLFPETPAETPNKIKNKIQTVNINPYAAQTPFTYPQAKPTQPNPEANIRYRNVAYGSDSNSYVSSDRVGQQNEDTVHGSAYSEHIQYNTHSTDQNDRFSPYPQPQPVYTSPDLQTENPGYISESVEQSYGIQNNIPDPVYEYRQAMRYSQELIRETTKSPIQETLHLGSEDVIEKQKSSVYTVEAMGMGDNEQPQFVVGNLPKELMQAVVTPVSVPEHGPRNLRRRKRNIPVQQHDVEIQSAADSLKEILGGSRGDDDLSNELNKKVDKSYKGYFPESSENDQASSLKKEDANYKVKGNSKEKQTILKENWIKYNKKPLKISGETSQEEVLKVGNTNLVNLKKIENNEENDVNAEYNPKFQTSVENIKPEQLTKIESSTKDIEMNDKYSEKVISKDIVKPEDDSKENDKINLLKSKLKAFSFTLATQKDEKYSQKTKHQVNNASPEIIMAIPYKKTMEKIPEENSPNSEEIITKSTISSQAINDDISTNTFVDQAIPPSTSNKSAVTQFIDLNNETDLEEPSPEEMQLNITNPDETSTKINIYNIPESSESQPPKPNVYNIPESTENPPQPFSLINFFKSLLNFKLRLGINVLQTTSEKLAKYLKDVEKSFQVEKRPTHQDNYYRQFRFY